MCSKSVALRVIVEEHGLARLDEVVDLVRGPLRELVDDLAAPCPAEQPGPVEQPGEAVHEPDVGLEDLADARALDLHRDAIPVAQRGPVDLADRRRGERGRLERGEHHLGLRAQLLADDGPDLLVAERRHSVEQAEQLVAVGGRQEVVPEREHLPSFTHAPPSCSSASRRRTGPVRLSAPGSPSAGAISRRMNTASTWPSRRGCLRSVLMERSGAPRRGTPWVP